MENNVTNEVNYASYQELKERGIKHVGPKSYPFGYEPGEYNVYTYTVWCNDGSVWGYSSEDEIFIQEAE